MKPNPFSQNPEFALLFRETFPDYETCLKSNPLLVYFLRGVGKKYTEYSELQAELTTVKTAHADQVLQLREELLDLKLRYIQLLERKTQELTDETP